MFMIYQPLVTPIFCSRSKLINLPLFWNKNIMTKPGNRSTFCMAWLYSRRGSPAKDLGKKWEDLLVTCKDPEIHFLIFFIVIQHSIYKKLFLLLTTLKTKMQTLSLYLRLINLSSLNTPVSSKVLPPQLQWLLVRILFSSYYMLYFWDPELMRFLRYIQDPKLLA